MNNVLRLIIVVNYHCVKLLDVKLLRKVSMRNIYCAQSSTFAASVVAGSHLLLWTIIVPSYYRAKLSSRKAIEMNI